MVREKRSFANMLSRFDWQGKQILVRKFRSLADVDSMKAKLLSELVNIDATPSVQPIVKSSKKQPLVK